MTAELARNPMRFLKLSPRLSTLFASMLAFALLTTGISPAVADSPLTGSISGQVSLGSVETTADAGTNAVKVQLIIPGVGPAGPPITTDATGSYTFTGLANGGYFLFFQYTGSGQFSSESNSNTPEIDYSNPVVIAGGAAMRANITLPPYQVVTGHVNLGTSTHSAGAGDVSITLTTDTGATVGAGTTTDANGNYSFTLGAGNYHFRFSPTSPNYQQQFETQFVNASPVFRTASTLAYSATIQGHVSLGTAGHSASAGQVKVGLQYCDVLTFNGPNCATTPTITTLTDANGNYSVSNGISGYYMLSFIDVADSNFQPLTGPTIHVDGTQPLYDNADVTLLPSATISGVVESLATHQAPPAGSVTVSAWTAWNNTPGSGPNATTTTAADGSYTIHGLYAGLYRIKFTSTSGGATSWWTQIQDGSTPLADNYYSGDTLTVASTPLTGVNYSIPQGANISGSITRWDGKPLDQGIQILLHRLIANSPYTVDTLPGNTNADGSYAFTNLIPGTYQVEFLSSVLMPPSISLAGVYAGSTLTDPGHQDTIVLTPGSNVTNENAIAFQMASVQISPTCSNCGGNDGPTVYGLFTPTLQHFNVSNATWTDLGTNYRYLPLEALWPQLLPGTYRVQMTSNSDTTQVTYGDPFTLAPGQSFFAPISVTAPSTVAEKPVYRFYSPKLGDHFYTMDESEKNHIIATYPASIWTYEGVAYNAYPTQAPGTVPLYRFWSPRLQGHFYTSSTSERDEITRDYPASTWTYEGVAYYVYPTLYPGNVPTKPVYRFWSPTLQQHFYTADQAEETHIVTTYPARIWTYERVDFSVPTQ